MATNIFDLDKVRQILVDLGKPSCKKSEVFLNIVREAPCKKSFGILASYWTPPKNQVNARLYLGRGVQGVKI